MIISMCMVIKNLNKQVINAKKAKKRKISECCVVTNDIEDK